MSLISLSRSLALSQSPFPFSFIPSIKDCQAQLDVPTSPVLLRSRDTWRTMTLLLKNRFYFNILQCKCSEVSSHWSYEWNGQTDRRTDGHMDRPRDKVFCRDWLLFLKFILMYVCMQGIFEIASLSRIMMSDYLPYENKISIRLLDSRLTSHPQKNSKGSKRGMRMRLRRR